MPKTKPVSLMLFFKCVQMLPFHFTCLMLSRHQVLSCCHIKNYYFRRFCDLSLFAEQRFEFIYETIFIRFYLCMYMYKCIPVYIYIHILCIYIYIYILFLFNISYNIAFNISFHLFLFYLTLHISFPFQKENQINMAPEINK